MKIQIDSIEYYLPEKIIDNDFLETECSIDIEFLDSKIGIQERHIADTNESTSDMAFKAADKLLQNLKLNRKEIKFLLVCTQNPDYKLPTTACILQDSLDLPKECFAFDINLGCSGYIYAMILAKNYLQNLGEGKALLIMADQYSRLINYKDKNTASLFGDAASASILSLCDDDSGIVDHNNGTDGSGFKHLIVRNSGTKVEEEANPNLYMNGREIFKFSMQVVPQSISDLLGKNNLKIGDIKYFVLHQANQYMLKEIQKKLQINDEQMVIDMGFCGNTVSSTLPIALKRLFEKKIINKGDYLVLSGFGVGLSWGSVLYKY